MTHEELLNKAKLKYPVDTKFISPQSGSIYTVTNLDFYTTSLGDIQFSNGKGITPFLYYKGRWAEISSTPVPTINNDYSIF